MTKPVQLLIDGVPPPGLQDSQVRYIDGDHHRTAGGHAAAVIAKAGVATDAVRWERAGGPERLTGRALIDALLSA